MNPRRWPIYTMSVGNLFFIANPTKSLERNLRQRAFDHGKVLSIRQAGHNDIGALVLVKRVV